MSKTGDGVGSRNRRAQLCLDFVNTVDWRKSDRPEDSLAGYADLVKWARRAGALSEGDARRLLREAASRPGEAAAAFSRGTDLREAVYRILSAAASGRREDAADLGILNDRLSEALSRLRVVPQAGTFAWGWDDGGALGRVLWPVARSAAELLVSDELSRVRECAGEGCGWLFVDASRNRLRRWCDMKSCGNRAKARRHYQRIKAAS